MQAQSHVIWPLISLGTSAGDASVHVSCAYPLMGNALRMSVFCINVTSSATFTARLQFSADGGLSRTDVGSGVNQNSLGGSSESVTAQNIGHWRVFCDLSGTSQDWVGRITVVETQQ